MRGTGWWAWLARYSVVAFCAVCAALWAVAAQAQPKWAMDVAGGSDHPLIQRFKDSWLIAYGQQGYDATTFPGRLGLGPANEMLAPVAVEGRITRLVYLAPLGKTPLEVHRNYEQALLAAGFKPLVACTPRLPRCSDMAAGIVFRYNTLKEADFSANHARHPDGSALYQAMHSLGGSNMMGTDDIHFVYGTLARGGSTVHVLLQSGKAHDSGFSTTYLEIAEPKLMPTGQVTVNADAIQAGLRNEGRVALYGIFFDTGKAMVKPESKAQLDEIARLLKAQPALKIHLVGHTDNQGAPEANLALSQQRAQAVAEALAQGYPVDAKRVAARGVGPFAPVASNAAEEGRARNRRVELVLP